MKVQCAVKGCDSVYASNETAAPNVKYVCSRHTREEQVTAVGRAYNPEADNRDQEAHFQVRAFDKDPVLNGGKSKRNKGYTHPLPEQPALYQSSFTCDQPLDLVEAAIEDNGSL